MIQRANFAEIPALVRRARAEGVDGINIQPVNLQHGSFDGDRIVRRDDVALMARCGRRRDQRAALDAMFDELERAQARARARSMHASPERLALLRRYFHDSSREALGVACRVGEAFLAVDHRGEHQAVLPAAVEPRRRAAHERARAVEQPGLRADARARRRVPADVHEQLLLPQEGAVVTDALWNGRAYQRTRAHVDACPLTCLNNCCFREKGPS